MWPAESSEGLALRDAAATIEHVGEGAQLVGRRRRGLNGGFALEKVRVLIVDGFALAEIVAMRRTVCAMISSCRLIGTSHCASAKRTRFMLLARRQSRRRSSPSGNWAHRQGPGIQEAELLASA
jgi:hypothetical protein